MAEPRRDGPDGAAAGRREPPRPDLLRVDAPPGASADQLAFPWAARLSLGWGPPPGGGQPIRRNGSARRPRRRVAE